MEALEDLPVGIGQYDDFHTIDWLRDISRDRTRHRTILLRRKEGCFMRMKTAHDAWSGWVCVLFVGCAAGGYRIELLKYPSLNFVETFICHILCNVHLSQLPNTFEMGLSWSLTHLPHPPHNNHLLIHPSKPPFFSILPYHPIHNQIWHYKLTYLIYIHHHPQPHSPPSQPHPPPSTATSTTIHNHIHHHPIPGICAAIVDIGATWMSDLKEGVCLEAFWLNREHCCWAANDTSFQQDQCSQVAQSCLI